MSMSQVYRLLVVKDGLQPALEPFFAEDFHDIQDYIQQGRGGRPVLEVDDILEPSPHFSFFNCEE